MVVLFYFSKQIVPKGKMLKRNLINDNKTAAWVMSLYKLMYFIIIKVRQK